MSGEKILIKQVYNTTDGHRHQLDNDIITYNSIGEITEWALWSDWVSAFVPVNINFIKINFPRTYADTVEMIYELSQKEKAEAG